MFPSHRQPQPRQPPLLPPTTSSATRVRALWRAPSSSELPPPRECGFLSPLQRQQQLVTQLLQVHALSDAIAYEPHAALRVNATAWWHELQQQSATAVRQRHSRKRRLINNGTGASSNGSSNGSMDSSLALSQGRHENLDEAKDVRVEMLVKILYSVSAWTKSHVDSDRATIDPAIQQVLIHIASAIGEVGMKLLDDWWRTCASPEHSDRDSVTTTTATTTNSDASAATQCSVEIVNVLLQFCDPVGTFHAFHAHKLCCCTAQRVFRSKPRWSCSKCARAWETQPAKPEPILVFRCAACEFTLCRECYTRIPNASHELQEIAMARELFSKPLSELHGSSTVAVSGFLPLVLRHVHAHDESVFATLAPKLAIAARDRLQELLLYRSQEMVPLLQMVVDLFAIPGFARVFITREPQLWMPLYISSAKMRLYSFLGPLMLWTSMSDEPGEINLTPEGRRDGKSTALTLQWHDGYRLLRPLLAKLLASLLDDTTQDPYVVDATLSYLATMVCCFGITRSSGHNTDDLYDGILINLSTALVQIVLPMLATSGQRRRIETVYHESHLPRRVYLERPEPLRTGSERDEAKSRAQEDLRIQHHDATMDCESTAQDFYYPPSEKHYGVLCDHCHGADFVGPRYKCAMCPDADICTTCYEAFSHKPFATTQASTGVNNTDEEAAASEIHRTDHVFYRLSVPMPLIAVYHYFPIDFTDQRPFTYEHTASDATPTTTMATAEATARELECAACHTHLDEFEVIFRCSNCLEPRFVCPSCVEHEERHCDPNRAHVPGHLYLAIPRTWRQHLNPRARALYSASLVYPACIYPRERLRIETELVYMTIQALHVGPIHSLAKFVSVVKEMQELRAFCACEEQRVESEKKIQKQQQRQQSTPMRAAPAPKLSAHYTASQARLADLGATRLMAEMHLLEAANVFDMISFYSRTCRWLLELAPRAGSTQDAFVDIVTHYSRTFSSFPEHFFFDVCDMVHVLTFDGTSISGNGVDFLAAEALRGGDDHQHEMVEPLLVMLVQLLATRKCTKNPHLRVQAAKALSALVAFYATNSKLVGVLRKVFQQCHVLKMFAVGAVLQFHEDMEGYHLRNNGLVFNNNAGSGDHLLWGFVGIRVTTVLLLRCMWQFVDQRTAMARAFQAKNSTLPRAAASIDPDVDVSSESRVANQVSMLIIGLWSDAAKLLEEGNGKVGVLAQLADIQEALREGRAIQLPFRESMLVGYIALHSKHLRIAMRMLVEVVELLSWMADRVPLKRAMLKSELVDQSTRTTCFLIASVMTAFQNKALESTWHHLQDSKRLFAHLVILVARCAGRGSSDKNHSTSTASTTTTTTMTTVGSPSQYWSLVQESGHAMLRFIGDVDASDRWLLNRAVVRMEAARYLGEDTGEDMGSRNHQRDRRDGTAWSRDPPRKDRGSNNDAGEDDDDGEQDADAERRDEDEELDENDALALLERQSAHALTTSATLSALPVVKTRERALTRQLGNRFISALAKDGRFAVESFVNGCELLRRRPVTTSSSSKPADDYEYVGASWMALYMEVLERCQDMAKLQALTDELLADIPDEYLDPLLSTIMTDPVQLPSGNIVDRAVIERHLLSAATSSRVDPFTREPLTLEMLVPCASLKREIRLYLRAKLQHLEHKKDDVLATWGLGWDSIFDATAERTSATA